jgi:DNA-binding NtrC family response regulator
MVRRLMIAVRISGELEPELDSAAKAPASPVEVNSSPFVIGRDPDANLVLDHSWVSRRQLVLTETPTGWSAAPEGRNAMTLNDAPLTAPRIIAPGDRITIGLAVLTLEAAPEEGAGDLPTLTLEVPLAQVLEPGRSTLQLGALGVTGAELLAGADPSEVGRRASTALISTLSARSAAVLLEPDGRVLESAGERSDRVSSSVSRQLSARALSSRSTLCFAGSIAAHRVGPVLVSPLGPPSHGVLYAERDASAAPFASEDAAFVTVLAHLTGAALEVADGRSRLSAERAELRRDIERRGRFGDLIGDSTPMQRLGAAIAKAASTEAAVLIRGETGSGKELVARTIHRQSKRREAPFFALNCAALPERRIEHELFGYLRGAFSGADRDRRGILELANGGTVYLDAIGALALTAQANLLRVLDARELLPLGGGGTPVKVDVRLVAATQSDLREEVVAGRFRQDLLDRLNGVPIEISPLRERKDDLPALVAHFFGGHPDVRKKRLSGPSAAFLDALVLYSFPGNVRELAQVIEQAAILADEGEELDLAHLPEEIARVGAPLLSARRRSWPAAAPTSDADAIPYPDAPSLRQMVGACEAEILRRELAKDGWNKARTANRLNIALRTFLEKLKRYGIREPSL